MNYDDIEVTVLRHGVGLVLRCTVCNEESDVMDGPTVQDCVDWAVDHDCPPSPLGQPSDGVVRPLKNRKGKA